MAYSFINITFKFLNSYTVTLGIILNASMFKLHESLETHMTVIQHMTLGFMQIVKELFYF